MTAQLTTQTLTRYQVFTFTRDLTHLGGQFRNFRPGVHFIVGELSESGYTFSAFDTSRQRWTDFMAEGWVFEETRVIGVIPAAEECACERECSACYPEGS